MDERRKGATIGTESPKIEELLQEGQGGRELEEMEKSPSREAVSTARPALSPRPEVDPSRCPTSYKENSPQEKLLLAVAENFHAQYSHLYPERKPLLLCPLNECGVPKFVSTTLRPTLLPYPELYSWEGCASFVSDFLSLEPLDAPIDPPKQLSSPTWVLQTRRGNCFDFSTLLCSLLLGAGYDAYCVSGYAVKEMCLLNQSHHECPLLLNEKKEKTEEQNSPVKKYSVKPPKDLCSGFERMQESKQQAQAQAIILQRQQEMERLEMEKERPSPDPLLGLWVHSWVLVLSGSREVAENFFIDPLTGKSFPTVEDCFVGVESIWNHRNYWVNMQDCRFGCSEMSYDLGDITRWEYLLFDPWGNPALPVSNVKASADLVDGDEDKEDNEEPPVFEMPPSWVKRIQISEQDMEMRYPGGMKVIQYRKARLEKFAPYLLNDGLVTRLTTYKDVNCIQPITMKEWFQHRQDYLQERQLTKADNVTMELFRPGRSYSLKSHRYVTLVPETEREMEFYSHARADGLAKRVELPTEMTETFEQRTDFLYHRHVVFSRLSETSDQGQRSIEKVVERFHRNQAKPASEDTAERVFLISEGRIQVTYHSEDDRIIPAWLSFVKPHDSQKQPFTSDMVSMFQVDPFEKPKKNLLLYEMLMSLMKEEEKVMLRVMDSEKEVRAILALREQEERKIKLHISIYNTARNEKARTHREMKARLAKEEQVRREQKELDYLAPFLAKLGDPETLTRQEALQLRSDCLTDLKQRLIDKANLIQACFEKETQELQLKQQWYQKNQLSMSKEDEATYLAYCSDAMFRIHVLKLRLSRHKDKAPQKYLALEEKLRRDPRLAAHLC
ncbi:dynein regulatory complex subunit 7 isoform X1 [Scleropages formosus]|uniref:dynein regulatory complex subunit 7 isoform X1 n=1 Tax=Scleropages formosus TaxID=113540 RepID=UPI000F395CD1|nr:dynein regulatory complex subunit 7 isoform X1 [Scleropages formosus]XP_029109500.1 dynein regulatory complex subunit 7 isoform X1 [Scleropages formosus]